MLRSSTPVARLAALLFLLVLAAPTALAQPATGLDTVRAQPLDGGKMWLFEDPPTEYLASRYNFRPDAAWFEKARLASLRMPGCSASFVSPHGLVATNHHCGQSSVIGVDRGGEGLLDAGFYARSLDEERPVAGMYMDQMVAIDDVTAEIVAAGDAATDADAAIAAATDAVVARLLAARGVMDAEAEDADYVVQVVPLYNGGRYSAYTFRRWRDVRLVMAPEARLGYFGGDYDNFTYPRYAADFSFFRVYGDDGRPLETEHYFPLSEAGVREGSVVFVVGNPGSTSRGLTVAELEFLRDVQLPATLGFYDSRVAALQAYLATGPDNPDAVRGQIFGLANGQKAFGGRLRGLSDPYIIARRRDAERDFTGRSTDAARLVGEQATLQAARRRTASAYRAFNFLFNSRYGSATLRRARALATGGDATEVASLAPGLERAYLVEEVRGLRRYYDETGAQRPAALAGGSAEAAADALLAASALDTGTSAPATDPAVVLVQALLPQIQAYVTEARAQGQRGQELARQLGRARFATYGSAVPPDATFSLRFTDGVVTGYPYNGTEAPPMTTLFGLYDRHYSYCVAGDGAPAYDAVPGPGGCDWELPQRWLDARGDVDLSTPVNFTSTSDTIGGNSGSPVIDREQRLVGLNFDRTIEGLVRDYLYAPERGRNVMVDARLIVEALREVYDLDALADELTEGRLRR